MIVTSAKYVGSVAGHNSHILATIDGTELGVPIDTGNRHYKAILEWVAAGNTITAAD